MEVDYDGIAFRPCSIRGCSRVLSDESTNCMCESCRGRHTKRVRRKADDTVDDWMLETIPSNPQPAAVPFWSQSIDPRIFSALAASSLPPSTSELANALVMPTTDQAQLPSCQIDSESAPTLVSSTVEAVRTDEARGEPNQDEDNQLRVCSVRACKQTVPVDYEYKMCPACRVRYQKYGTTKRAKWKVVREREKQKACSIEAPRSSTQSSHPIQDTGKLNMPLATPLPADKAHTTSIETEVLTERDQSTLTAPGQQYPSRLSADDLSVQPQLLPQMHQPLLYSAALHSSPSSSSSPNISFIHEQVPRPPSNPIHPESDPIINGFSKFRVELFERELDGRYMEGTVISAPHIMKLGEPPKSGAGSPPAPRSVSLQRTVEMSSTEDHVKVPHDASGLELNESPSMTRPIVPVSLIVYHPVTSETQAAVSGPSQVQNDTQAPNTKDGPSSQPSSTTSAPKTKGKRKTGPRAKATAKMPNTPRASSSLAPPNTAPPPQLYPGYPPPHPYPYYPYYPMYFPPYPGAYQYPYLPMPFAAPPSSPSKTKKKKKSAQVADVARSTSTPIPHPGAYPYPPGHPGAWAYPTPQPPPPTTSSLPPGSASSVYPVPQPQLQPPPPPPPASSLYAISAPYSLPGLHQPSQGPSAPVRKYPHLSGTQPYSGTPLTTLMPIPFFSIGTSAPMSSGGGPRKDKGKEVERDVDMATGKESYQIHAQKQPHVQMQFNYYHYGMGTSQSPTTPESHARKKRRKIDPNYREKMEMFRNHETATAVANPESASSSSAPVPPSAQEPQPNLSLNPLKSTTEKEAVAKVDLDEKLPEPSLRRCSKKGCTRALPNADGNNNRICVKCKTKFKKMTEKTKERFRLVPKQTVCDRLGK